MTTFRKMRMNFVLLSILILSFSSCIDESYDLNKGINTDMTVGGDSLAFPILQKAYIYLDSMMNSQDIEMLRRMQDGTYSLHLNDSMQIKMNNLSPVTLSIDPISIAPINTAFSSLKLPAFQFNPISFQSPISIPNIDLDKNLLQPINSSYTQDFPINIASNIKKFTTSSSDKAKAANYKIGPFRKIVHQTVDETILYLFPKELKKINKISFNNMKVTLTFDKTKTNQLGLVSQNDTIKEFKIDFPSEYKLSRPSGMNSRIDGNSFIIDDAALTKGVNVFTASFYIESLDMTNIFQFESLNYNKQINCSYDYSFVGETDDITAINNKNVEYTVSLQATPAIEDIEIETNSFGSSVPESTVAIQKVITGIPEEISQLSSVTFEDGAVLQITIPDPGLFPYAFSEGICQIALPKTFVFKPFNGLNTTTNILTVPYNEIFGVKNIGIAGLNINKFIPEGQTSLDISDELKYSVSGLAIGAQSSTLNVVKAINNKIINITGLCIGLTVKYASLITRRISVDLPEKTAAIDVSKFISKDVKRIYSAGLKSPSEIKFKVNINDLPTSIDSVFFENYTIKLPTYLKFKSGDVNSNNEVIINRGFKVSEGFSKTLTLEKIDFGTTGKFLESGVFSLNDLVSLKGKIYIKGTNLNTSDLGTIQIKPAIEVNDISLSVIEAEVSPTIAPIVTNFKINLPEFVKNDSTKLDLQKPVITLDIANTMGLAVDADITLVPKRNGIAVPNTAISGKITIAAATVLGKATSTKIWIATSNEGISSQYKALIIPELANLLKIAPDEIDIVVTPTIAGERQIVDLYSTANQLNINYSFNVPLDFGSEFKIQYGDTLTNLNSKIVQVIKYTRLVELMAAFENKIPLDLNFEVKPIDISKHILTGIKIDTSDSIKSCNIDGTPRTSLLNIKLSETTVGALDKLDGFILKIWATKNSTIAGMPLKTDQFITLEMRMRIPDGIKITDSSKK